MSLQKLVCRLLGVERICQVYFLLQTHLITYINLAVGTGTLVHRDCDICEAHPADHSGAMRRGTGSKSQLITLDSSARAMSHGEVILAAVSTMRGGQRPCHRKGCENPGKLFERGMLGYIAEERANRMAKTQSCTYPVRVGSISARSDRRRRHYCTGGFTQQRQPEREGDCYAWFI